MKHIVAINSNCYHGYSIEEAIAGISVAGFHYIELTTTKGWTEHVFLSMSFSYLNSAKDKLKQAGLVPFSTSGYCNLMEHERIGNFVKNMQLAAPYFEEYNLTLVLENHHGEHATGEIMKRIAT